jgi:lysophospholipase L1-like esterase
LTDKVNVPLERVTGLENRLANAEDDITALETSVNAALDTGILFNFSGFIRYDGALIANTSYVSTDYVDILSGGTFVPYRYRLQMFANTKIAYYNESKVFISAISPSESGTIEYVDGIVPYVDGAKYVRFCTAKNAVGYYVKYASVKNVVVNGATDMNPCNYGGNDMLVFNKVLCIGDSLTSGTFNYRVGGTTGNYIEDAKYSYPTYLKKLTGCDTVNMGNGGMSSAEWYNAHKNDDLSGYDCAIIQLGVNDCIRYATWVETSETAFTNIINKLKAENKNIKIFVANIIPATSYSNAQYLAFSADLLAWVESTYASDANVIPLDMQQYGHTKDSPAYNCGHLSALGYRRLAQDYKGYIGWYINQNKTAFKEVQFIGTDYYYDPV